MENIQLLRSLAILEQRLRAIETSSGNPSASSSLDLSNFTARLEALEARPVVDLSDVSSRLAVVEARPVVDLSDVSSRLAAVEARPELSQRLSALELAVTTLNSN